VPVPPLRFVAGRADHGLRPRGGPLLRGTGTGGRVRARVGDGAGEVRVVPTLLPSGSAFLIGAAGVVTDHGGLLSHGATQAREYGIPAVLGTRSATSTLRPGDQVLVDAERGEVYLLDR
jgi:pyruvate,water dikinase